MWQLHNTIKAGLPEKNETYLIHQVMKVIEGITTPDFENALSIMYDKNFMQKYETSDFAVMFVKGVKKNNVFAFSSFIKELLNGNAH